MSGVLGVAHHKVSTDVTVCITLQQNQSTALSPAIIQVLGFAQSVLFNREKNCLLHCTDTQRTLAVLHPDFCTPSTQILYKHLKYISEMCTSNSTGEVHIKSIIEVNTLYYSATNCFPYLLAEIPAAIWLLRLVLLLFLFQSFSYPTARFLGSGTIATTGQFEGQIVHYGRLLLVLFIIELPL